MGEHSLEERAQGQLDIWARDDYEKNRQQIIAEYGKGQEGAPWGCLPEHLKVRFRDLFLARARFVVEYCKFKHA